MTITGVEFENLVKPFFETIFKEMDYIVFDVRNQNSGTQNGFDLVIDFLDENSVDRQLFIECKFYSSKLYYKEILMKVLELNASNYTPDGFIALSPKENLSNINHNVNESLQQSFKFPIEFWTPDFKIEEIIALDEELYQKVYEKKMSLTFNREVRLNTVREKINFILSKKDLLLVSNIIEINDSTKVPNESKDFKTKLDDKLNAVFDENHELRIRLHQYRCNYKIYLEKLEDVNNILRTKILNWQENLRMKAERLTFQFQTDDSYTATKFYGEFFNTAEQSLLEFYSSNDLTGDNEKLLHGVVLELAAECPLNWNKS